MSKKRQILFSAGAILLLLIFAGAMLIVGRGHTVYVDSKSMDYEGQKYTPPYKVVVYVNGEQIAKLYDKERGMSTCIGQNFTMTLEITDVQGGAEKTATYNVRLPYNMDGVTINLPGLLAGLPEEAYIAEFIIIPTEPADEEVVTDEFDLPDDELEDAG